MKLEDLVNEDSLHELSERLWVERVDFWVDEFMRVNKDKKLYSEDIIVFFMNHYKVSKNFARYCADMHIERRYHGKD